MKNYLIIVIQVIIFLPLFGQNEDILFVGVRHEPPFIIKESGDNFSGLSIDLWKSIAQESGRSYELVEYNDHLGLIRGLDFKEIDLTINPIHVNEIRLKMLDVTQPFFVSSIGLAKTNVQRTRIGTFFRNFFSVQFFRIVILLVLIMFVFGTVLWIAERKHNMRQFRPGIAGLFDGLWWSAVTMTTVGYGDKAPKSKLGRVIAMVWMFTAIIIISGFTASIASTLTLSSLSSNFQDLEDLRNAGEIGSVYGTSSEDFLKLNDINIHSSFGNVQEALLALSSRDIEVLIYDKTVLDYFIGKMQLSKRVTLLPVRFNTQYCSFFLPKNSIDLEWINPLLVRKTNEVSWHNSLKSYGLQVE